MRREHTVVALGLISMVLLTSTSGAESQPPASPEVTAAMQPYRDGYKLAGVIAIIADKGGKVHFKNLLGYADVEAKKPISEDNVFWIASMSKMFAGASIMMLMDEGKLSLDDPVTKKYAYGNQGMNIAARIVEIVSGVP
jgi:CubicO group peptidase (beta-lactamase class C family)